MFTREDCSYCDAAYEVLGQCGVKANVIELNGHDDGREIKNYLWQETGQRTVPNIFIKSKHFGGCSDLERMQKKGKLGSFLDKNGIPNSCPVSNKNERKGGKKSIFSRR